MLQWQSQMLGEFESELLGLHRRDVDSHLAVMVSISRLCWAYVAS